MKSLVSTLWQTLTQSAPRKRTLPRGLGTGESFEQRVLLSGTTAAEVGNAPANNQRGCGTDTTTSDQTEETGVTLNVLPAASPDRRYVQLEVRILEVQINGGTASNGQAGFPVNVTIQLPALETVSVSTTVSVPDGGTVLLGGLKSSSEGRNETGVPALNQLPYVSRLFKNVGIGRETESLMLMVTPRIIIQE